MSKPRKPEEYPIWIKQVGQYLWAYNFDFNIHHHEEIRSGSRDERLLQTVKLISSIQDKIADHLKFLDRNGKAHPTPLSSEDFFKPNLNDEISLKEVCQILGEAPHTVRRMADEGILEVRRTRKGHRRFLRSAIEKYYLTIKAEILEENP